MSLVNELALIYHFEVQKKIIVKMYSLAIIIDEVLHENYSKSKTKAAFKVTANIGERKNDKKN